MGIFDFFNDMEFSDFSEDEYMRIFSKIEDKKYHNGFDLLTAEEKAYYVCYLLDMEIQNGGLCQFFVNSSKKYAPLVKDCLKTIGAVEHSQLFDRFVKENKIDLTDLSKFDIDGDFEEMNEIYPFDDFDDAYCELDPIEELLFEYAKKNNL